MYLNYDTVNFALRGDYVDIFQPGTEFQLYSSSRSKFRFACFQVRTKVLLFKCVIQNIITVITHELGKLCALSVNVRDLRTVF